MLSCCAHQYMVWERIVLLQHKSKPDKVMSTKSTIDKPTRFYNRYGTGTAFHSILIQNTSHSLYSSKHFWSSVSHWLQLSTDQLVIPVAVQESTNRNNVPEVVGMLEGRDKEVMQQSENVVNFKISQVSRG